MSSKKIDLFSDSVSIDGSDPVVIRCLQLEISLAPGQLPVLRYYRHESMTCLRSIPGNDSEQAEPVFESIQPSKVVRRQRRQAERRIKKECRLRYWKSDPPRHLQWLLAQAS